MSLPNDCSIHGNSPTRGVQQRTNEHVLKDRARSIVLSKIVWALSLDDEECEAIKVLIARAIEAYTPRMVFTLLSGLSLPGGQVAVLNRRSIWGLAHVSHPDVPTLARVVAVCLLCFGGPDTCRCDD